MHPDHREPYGLDIAVVGLSCRFPGAAHVAEYWSLIKEGRIGISRFDQDELRRAGAGEDRLRNPALVGAAGIVPDGENFDAAFFGYSAREAALMDPQQRMFLESAWHALEDAGYAPGTFPGKIGVYAGQTLSTHRTLDLDSFLGNIGDLLLSANDKDFLPTRVSYKLDLTGPSVNVQAACSTSLIAIHLACQALLAGECDLALAGGVSWSALRRQGYLHQPGGTLSADGYVRPFDQDASGFVPADGLGIVVLRRLADAVESGDHLYAVVKGSAVNNDGAARLSYSAPGVAGQRQVSAEALAVAGVDPQTIGYVEAHGTATAIGDVVEFAALTEAYRSAGAANTGCCGLGSVKSNIGHTDAAAGAAGFIKAALMLQHQFLPPSPTFRRPNKEIDVAGSPFSPQVEGIPWPRPHHPRRAAVSSFGIGGTNAHLVLEEAPARPPSGPSRPWQVLALSAHDPRALRALAEQCARFLDEHPHVHLADLAYTVAVGRRQFRHRLAGVFRDRDTAVRALHDHARGGQGLVSGDATVTSPEELVFLFPGDGAQHDTVDRGLYEHEPVFRDCVDECLGLLPDPTTVPALLITQLALGRLLISLGLRPTTLLGHRVGEYAAAYFAGVLPLRDALGLVAVRGGVTDPQYWMRHPRRTTHVDSLDDVLLPRRSALVEVGPGTPLSALAREHATRSGAVVVRTTPDATQHRGDSEVLLQAVCRLWSCGAEVDLSALFAGERRARVPAMRYPFAPVPCRLETTSAQPTREPSARQRPADWLYGVSWKRSLDVARPGLSGATDGRWVVLSDGSAVADDVLGTLRRHGADPVVVTAGTEFRRMDATHFVLAPEQPAHYALLLADVGRQVTPLRVVDLWSPPGSAAGDPVLAGALGMAHAVGSTTAEVELCLVTRGAFGITGREQLNPAAAGTIGMYRTLPLELPRISVRTVDLDPAEFDAAGRGELARALLTEFGRADGGLTGYRGGHRWVRYFEPLAPRHLPAAPLRRGGVYVIIGGTGGIGRRLAEHLATSYQARLVLVGRTAPESANGTDPVPADLLGRRGMRSADVLIRRADVTHPRRFANSCVKSGNGSGRSTASCTRPVSPAGASRNWWIATASPVRSGQRSREPASCSVPCANWA